MLSKAVIAPLAPVSPDGTAITRVFSKGFSLIKGYCLGVTEVIVYTVYVAPATTLVGTDQTSALKRFV